MCKHWCSEVGCTDKGFLKEAYPVHTILLLLKYVVAWHKSLGGLHASLTESIMGSPLLCIGGNALQLLCSTLKIRSLDGE